MADELGWLVEQKPLSNLFGRSNHSVARDVCSNALENIKAALFAPFKPDATKWSAVALQLLHHHIAPKGVLTIQGEKRSDSEPYKKSLVASPDKAFPCSYSTILTFLRDFAVAANASKNPAHVTKLNFESENGGKFVLTLSADPVVKVPFLRNRCEQVMDIVGRDWRIENANYGDMTRAFVLFANRLMGVGKEWALKKCLPQQIISIATRRTEFGVTWLKDQKQLVVWSKST
jgi:hypothetical protein